MTLVVVDVESDGPNLFRHSMVCFGAAVVEPAAGRRTFYGQTAPIHQEWLPGSLAISGFTREQHLTFDKPEITMPKFRDWLKSLGGGRPTLITDNLAFDWKWSDAYLLEYAGENPFGWSGRRIGDLYCGYKNDFRIPWKHLRTTKHTHHPVDDAVGNVEAILKMKTDGLSIHL